MAKILLAEDDASMRGFISRALEKGGHSVTPCAHGAQALDIVRDGNHFDLLLTDIVMPLVDGFELATRVRSLCPDIKIMFITGFAAMSAARAVSGKPDVSLLSKPFHLGNLLEEVERLLSKP